nr:hypothetical protein GTC16762_33680 [Pigmentibacter ruber]
MVRLGILDTIINAVILTKHGLKHIIIFYKKVYSFFFFIDTKTIYTLHGFIPHGNTYIVKFSFKYIPGGVAGGKLQTIELTELYSDRNKLEGFSKEEMVYIFYKYWSVSMKENNEKGSK